MEKPVPSVLTSRTHIQVRPTADSGDEEDNTMAGTMSIEFFVTDSKS